jgi:type VI secretion system protein ImpA
MDWSGMRHLLEPLPGEDPAGLCLEYTPEFLELVDAGLTHEEQQYGNVVAQARGVDEQKLVRLARVLAEQTRDLRVAIALTDGLCRTEGWLGLAFGLEVVADWTISQWETVHPQLEADDDFDPIARINILAFLTDDRGLLRSVRDLKVTDHRTMGILTLSACRELWMRDSEEYGDGLSHTVNTSNSGNPSVAIAARSSRLAPWFEGTSQEWIADRLSEIDRAIKALNRVTQFINKLSGMLTLDQKRLSDLLRTAKEILCERLTIDSSLPELNSGASNATNVAQLELSEPAFIANPVSVTSDLAARVSGSHASSQTIQRTGEIEATDATSTLPETITIRSRAQAVEALDAICDYFTKHEPASPVPLLIQRAKRLVPMSFAEILRELSSGNGPSLLQQLMGCEEVSS